MFLHTRNSAIWVTMEALHLIEKIVPPSASSNRPSAAAPSGEEPFSCPNNSEAIKSRGMAAQLRYKSA